MFDVSGIDYKHSNQIIMRGVRLYDIPSIKLVPMERRRAKLSFFDANKKIT